MSRSRQHGTGQLNFTARSELKCYEAEIDRGHYKGPAPYRKRKKGAKRFLRARIRRDNKLAAKRETDND